MHKTEINAMHDQSTDKIIHKIIRSSGKFIFAENKSKILHSILAGCVCQIFQNIIPTFTMQTVYWFKANF